MTYWPTWSWSVWLTIPASGDPGVVEIELGRMEGGERLQHFRMLIRLDVGIAGERGFRRQNVLLGRGQRALGLLQRQARIVQRRIGDDAALHQSVLAIIGRLGEIQRVGRRLALGDRLAIGRFQLGDVEPCRFQPCLVALDGIAIDRVVDGEKEIAGLDGLVLLHRDLGDLAGNLGHDRHPVLLHIGVLGLDIAAPGHPVIRAGGHQ